MTGILPILIIFVLMLETYSSAVSASQGPEIFKFTSQPVSQTVNSGGSVTLSCVATGRSGITYSWYKLYTGFSIPPTNTDLINGEEGTTYVVQAADVDESGEERLFQCKATAGSDVILSNVATVLYKLLADNIEYNNTGKSYINTPISTPSHVTDLEVFLFSLPCNTLEKDFDMSITNGEAYDVQWFKDTETDRVEVSHSNMWTYYSKAGPPMQYDGVVAADYAISRSNIKNYDLFIFNVQKSDAGTYSCKAVSRKNKQKVLLGSTVLTVPAENNQYTIKPKTIAAGYMVLAVDSAGKMRDRLKVGDEVLLMCGVACRTSSGSWDSQYQWKDSNGTVIANTREHIVTLSSYGWVSYTCEILNSECTSKLSSARKSVFMTVEAADLDPTLQFTFSKSPPEYMWYDTSDNSKSHDPFKIGCKGSYSSGNTDVVFHNSVLRVPDRVASSGDDVVYDFGYSFTSDKSGVYQCVMFNVPDKVVLYQQTTNVIITTPPSAAITLTTSSGSSARFTCTVGGFPIESVTISGPNNVNLDCMTTQTSGDVSCSSTDQRSYVVNVQNFKLEYAGDYTCTVKTKLYKAENSTVEYSAKDRATFEKESTTELTTSSTTVQYGEPVTLTCVVEGYPEPTEPTLTKSGSSKQIEWSSSCTGTIRKECLKRFLSITYSDSGEYVCTGSNTIDGTENKSEGRLDLLIVRSTEVTISNKALSVLTNGSVYVLCTVVGKPLVDISVSWIHETLTDLDLSQNVTTVRGSQDNYTLVSILSIVNPSTEYSGIFNCNVRAENDQVITKSVEVSINNREFLNAPKITHNGGQDIGQDVDMSITCLVEGFPRPSATLIYKNLINSEHIQSKSETSSIDHISPASTEFAFQLITRCDYSQYQFICETKNIKITDGREQKESSSVDGPIVTGCPSPPKSIRGVMISSGVAALLFVIIVVGGIYILHLRRRLSPNSVSKNVVYLNTTPENLGAGEQFTEQNYETLDEVNSSEQEYNDVVLHVSNGAAANVNTAVPSRTSPALHLYNDVVLPTRPTGDTQYAYAVRNKVKSPVFNKNHHKKK